MRWLRRLLRPGASAAEVYAPLWVEVRCGKCSEVIRVRVDPRYELRQDVEDGRDVLILDKDLLGAKCFSLLHIHAVLTPDHTVRVSDVSGGELIRLSRAPGG